MKKTFISGLLISLLLILFAGCYTPSPLYGSWSDNAGNKISFFDDGSFSSNVLNAEGTSIDYSGNYMCIDNVLIFNTNTGISINTEWDIRGAILYLTWTPGNEETKNLTLYHTSR
jgi:hypothetical protein